MVITEASILCMAVLKICDTVAGGSVLASGAQPPAMSRIFSDCVSASHLTVYHHTIIKIMASLAIAGGELGLRLRMTKIVAHSSQQNFVWTVVKLNIQNTKIGTFRFYIIAYCISFPFW